MRIIRPEEKSLVLFMLSRSSVNPADYPVAEEVSEYEGGIMGSISFAGSDPDRYAGDLIQAEYTDSDGIEVIITLTRDESGKLLDLDFWKMDFSKLLRYPSPDNLRIP